MDPILSGHFEHLRYAQSLPEADTSELPANNMLAGGIKADKNQTSNKRLQPYKKGEGI